MNYKDKINLIESIELDSIRYNFENPTSFHFEKEILMEEKIEGYWVELDFIVTGRNIKPRFGSAVIIDDVTIKEIKIWLKNDELAIISDSDILKFTKILTTKMKELL